jgi:hypothetical protein
MKEPKWVTEYKATFQEARKKRPKTPRSIYEHYQNRFFEKTKTKKEKK